MGRRVARWNPPAQGPVKALEGAERLRRRAHDAVANDWAAGSSTQKWVTNLVGVGITPVWKDRRYRDVWQVFAKTADADSVLDAYGLQVLGARAMFEAGEVFLRERPRRSTSPLEVPVQVQLLESEFCPLLDTDQWPGLPEGNRIVQGIEVNRYGERTAYWFHKAHPDDGKVIAKDDLIRVAASQVSHLYEVNRPGQIRGVSPLANILLRLRSTGDLEDAVLERQKLANLFAMFITRDLPDVSAVDVDPLTGLPVFYDNTGAPLATLEPGVSHELKPGEDVKFAAPPPVGVTYAEYLRGLLTGAAAGQGLPYELMSGDIKDVSDRTLRVLINEFRRYCQQRQWITLIPRLCQPMVDWCMRAAVLRGLVPPSRLAEASAPTWRPQGWEYIHPVQDAQGKRILLDMGVISKTALIGERGDDRDQVFDERQDDAAAEAARNLGPAPTAPLGGPNASGVQAFLNQHPDLIEVLSRLASKG